MTSKMPRGYIWHVNLQRKWYSFGVGRINKVTPKIARIARLLYLKT